MSEKKGKNNQLVVSPPSVQVRSAAIGVEEAREYLRKAGWIEESINDRGESFWTDPVGLGKRKGEKLPKAKLPGRDGTDPVIVTQTVCPPSSWTYSLQEAVRLQRGRDEKKV